MTVNSYAVASIDPYSFYPSKIFKPKDRSFFKASRDLIDKSPFRPLVITDKNGNKMYVTSQGDVMVSVDKSGNKTFSIRGRRSHQRDSKDRLTQKWERKAGSNMIVVKNEFDETTGIQEQGLGSKIVAEYDADGNLTKSYEYNKYGKQMQWIVDELTQSRVRYDKEGKAVYDVDCEGNKTATYTYDVDGRLKYRDDIYGNRTFFDKKGNRIKTAAKEGYLITTYKYEKDKNGYYQVESVKDELTGSITLYKDGKQYEVRNYNGLVINTYKWQGTELIYTKNSITNEITWFKTGKPTYTTYKGELTKEWMYYQGKLLGIWDEDKNNFALYSRGRQEMQIQIKERPQTQDILKIYEIHGLKI